jgi:hypothetical protein
MASKMKKDTRNANAPAHREDPELQGGFPHTQCGLEDFIEALALSGAISRSSLKAATEAKLAKFQIWNRKAIRPSNGGKKVKASAKTPKVLDQVQQVGRKALLKEARASAVQKIARRFKLINDGDEFTFKDEQSIAKWNNASVAHFGAKFFARDSEGKFAQADRKETVLAFLKEIGLNDLEKSASFAVFPLFKAPSETGKASPAKGSEKKDGVKSKTSSKPSPPKS